MAKKVRRLDHIGDYSIHRIIGQGAWGKVYQCVRRGSQNYIAVKVLDRKLGRDPDVLARFDGNAGAAAQLRHPNIVRVREIGTFEGRHYFTMDFVEGENLRDRLERRGKLLSGEAIRIVTEAADALDAAYEKGITHSNLKLENFLICRDGTLKLTDFCGGGPGSGGRSQADSDEEVTPPDELAMGGADTRKDAFDLGAVFYHMLTGEELPSAASGGLGVRQQAFRAIPDEIRPVLSRMLDPDPEDRFQEPAELREALDRIAPQEEEHDTRAAAAVLVPDTGPEPAQAEAEPETDEEEAKFDTAEGSRGAKGLAASGEGESAPRNWTRLIVIASTVVALVVCVGGVIVLKRSWYQDAQRHAPDPLGAVDPAGDPEGTEPETTEEPPEEPAQPDEEFAEALRDADSRIEALVDSGHFGAAIDVVSELTLDHGDREEIRQRERQLSDLAVATFAIAEAKARECGDPQEAIKALRHAAETFGLVHLHRRAESVIREFEALLETQPKEKPEPPQEVPPEDELGLPPADDEETSAAEPGGTEAEEAVEGDAKQPSPVAEGTTGSPDPLADDLLRYFRDRDYALARKRLMQECAKVTDPAELRHLTGALDLMTEAEQFWTEVQKGARQMVGRRCSFGLLTGAGSIRIEGVLKTVGKANLVVDVQGRDVMAPLRSLQVEDAAKLSASVLRPLDGTTHRALAVAFLFEADLEKAREWLETAGTNGQDVESLTALLDDPKSTPRRVEKAKQRGEVTALLTVAKEGSFRGTPEAMKERLAKHAEAWKGTELGKEIEEALQKLSEEPEEKPEVDVAAELWESARQNALKQRWKRVLERTRTLAHKHQDSETYVKNEDAIKKLAAEASMRICEEAADEADSRERSKLTSQSRPGVVAVRQDGKGDASTLDEAIGKAGTSGIIVLSAGRFAEQISVRSVDGTVEKPFAILGVPGGRAALSGLRDIQDCRENRDGLLWFPSLQLPDDPKLLQEGRPLTSVGKAPDAPGTYHVDEKAKRCTVVPFKTEDGRKPTFQTQAFAKGNLLQIRSCNNLLIRDLVLEHSSGAVSFQDKTANITLHRVSAYKHGPLSFGGGPVILKDCILPVTCRFPGARQISATGCVFRTVELAKSDVPQEALFRNCVFLGGLISHNDPHTRLVVRNCVFFQCQDAIKLDNGDNVEITDCIFADALQCAIAVQKEADRMDLRNICFWHNGSDYGGAAKAGTRCFRSDPLFAHWEKGDYRLQPDSPCRGKAADGGDLGVNWNKEQWGRWFRYVLARPDLL